MTPDEFDNFLDRIDRIHEIAMLDAMFAMPAKPPANPAGNADYASTVDEIIAAQWAEWKYLVEIGEAVATDTDAMLAWLAHPSRAVDIELLLASDVTDDRWDQ